MDITAFKKILGRSNRKKMIVGAFIFAFGVFIAWLLISGADKSSDVGVGGEIVLVVLIILCCGLGGISIWMGAKSALQIKGGSHPLIKAITDGDKGYVLWIYENVHKVQGGGSNHQVVVFTTDVKKGYHIDLKKNNVHEVIRFLADHFPNAVLGYSEEMLEKMNTFRKSNK